MSKKIKIVTLFFICVASTIYSLNQISLLSNDIKMYVSAKIEHITYLREIQKLYTLEADTKLFIPIKGLQQRDITDTWGSARSNNRTHEGVDIFAKKGTEIFSATNGYVIDVGVGELGGNYVFVIGKGGVRYYYAHLDSIATHIIPGTKVTIDTVLGFVGNTGNARNTPPHLHFGMYNNGAQNPHALLIEKK